MRGNADHDACIFAGLDPKKVASIARRISRAAVEARAMGICIFGGSGSGTLRVDCDDQGPLIVGELEGNFDGGAGNEHFDENGFTRGE